MDLSIRNSGTLEKQNQDLQQVNRELDQFVYSISHDLRAPLTSDMGLVELVKLEDNPNKLPGLYHMMEQSLKRLDRFIHDILDYSRNTRLKVVVGEVNLKHLVQDVFADLEFAYGSRVEKIALDHGNPIAHTDKRRIMVVLNNLISNALKYGDPKKPNPYVAVKTGVMNDRIIIEVADNGLGIESAHLGKVFQMFYRASIHSKGSGLGLYIVSESIKTLCGRIDMQSTTGMGTIVTVDIPNQPPL
ncbi:MAG: HAMP domain-containing histidine kinase [Bacteroidetes bacterium]|nr:HAMP domain-containing histidine kinase [Bacteroidota bacterium]